MITNSFENKYSKLKNEVCEILIEFLNETLFDYESNYGIFAVLLYIILLHFSSPYYLFEFIKPGKQLHHNNLLCSKLVKFKDLN